jgi:hypothetical protein
MVPSESGDFSAFLGKVSKSSLSESYLECYITRV